MKEPTSLEPPDKGSTDITTVAPWANKESGRVIADGTITNRVGNFKLERTDTLTQKGQFGIPPTEVVHFAKRSYKVHIGLEVSKSALYYTACLADTGAGSYLTPKTYLRLPWKSRIKGLDAAKLRSTTKS